jgi:16S rRNA G527 N7-methylase RsmG
MTPQDPMVEVIERLKKRISYLESVLSEIQMLNALGKTLKIDEAIKAAIEK